MLIIAAVCGAVGGAIALGAIYFMFKYYQNYSAEKSRLGDQKNWKANYTPNLRGNLVKTYTTDIELDFYLDCEQELGKGGCGVVVVGEHKETHAQYAIKIVDKSTAERGRLDRELKLLKDVDHTNIVRLFSVYDVPKNMYFVMELCLGGHLGNLLSRQPDRCIDEEWGKKLCKQLLSAIVHIHSRGIAHRDIKLQNILIDNNHDQKAQLKLIDFGFGSRFIGVLPMKTKCGTPYTTAPEVIRECYDERCDVWSLGVVLYIMLCGKRPFEALDVNGPLQEAGKAAMITNILAGRYHFNHKAWQNVSKTGIAFVKALLHPDYRNRVRSRDALDHPWLKSASSSDIPSLLLRQSSSAVISNMKKASEASELQRTGMMALVFGMQTKTSTDLRAIFQSFDSDSSGSLSRAEFLVAIQQLSPELTTADSNILFDTIDVDHNQQISYTEFLAATIDPREIDLDELSKAFHLLDEDGNGFITQAELTKVRVLCRAVLSRVVDVLICLFPSFLVFLSVVIRC
jgi:calcium-dependent protein kinase